MHLRGISVFLAILVLATVLLLGQSVMAIEPGPVTPEEGKALIQQEKIWLSLMYAIPMNLLSCIIPAH